MPRLPGREGPPRGLRAASRVALAAAVWAASGGDVVAQAATPAAGGVLVASSERFYELDEHTLGGVIERLNGMRLEGAGGRLSQGLTTYRIDPTWVPHAARGRCRVSGLRVQTAVVVTLPRWTRAGRATPDDRARWAEIERAIRDHEHEHRDLTVEAAYALHARLSSLETAGCARLGRLVDGEVALARARLERAHAELDARTPKTLRPGGG